MFPYKIVINAFHDWYEVDIHEDLTASEVIDSMIRAHLLEDKENYQLCYTLSPEDRPNQLKNISGNKFRIFQPETKEVTIMPADPKNVFVVCGRNEKLNKDIYSFLRAIGLNPIEWGVALNSTNSGTPFIGEVLEAGFKMAKAAVVVLTGDDVAKLRDELIRADDPNSERELTPQPRQNVLFEAGMAYGLYPKRTVIVSIGKMRYMSDLSGRHIIYLDNSPAKRKEFAQRLERIGCTVGIRGDDWLEIGDFE